MPNRQEVVMWKRSKMYLVKYGMNDDIQTNISFIKVAEINICLNLWN